jgi:hypothetical protein
MEGAWRQLMRDAAAIAETYTLADFQSLQAEIAARGTVTRSELENA